MDGVKWENLMPANAALSTENSGVDDDVKRYQTEAKECWQAGFSNSHKILETLKNGGKYSGESCRVATLPF